MAEDDSVLPSDVHPTPIYSWPNKVLTKRWARILENTINILRDRADYPSAKSLTLTYWPHLDISVDQYKTWRVKKDRNQDRKPDRRIRGTDPAEIAALSAATSMQSKKMRACDEKVKLAVTTLFFAGVSALMLPNKQGYHICLDLLDGIGVHIGSDGFVVDLGPVPRLVNCATLRSAEVTAIKRIVFGTPPFHLNSVGHFAFGEMLNSLANQQITLLYLSRMPDAARGHDKQENDRRHRLLAPRQPMDLQADDEGKAAVVSYRKAFASRYRAAKEREQRHKRRNPNRLPQSGRYA